MDKHRNKELEIASLKNELATWIMSEESFEAGFVIGFVSLMLASLAWACW